MRGAAEAMRCCSFQGVWGAHVWVWHTHLHHAWALHGHVRVEVARQPHRWCRVRGLLHLQVCWYLCMAWELYWSDAVSVFAAEDGRKR